VPPEGTPETDEALGVAMVVPDGTVKLIEVNVELDDVVKL
jgi:hypothetical protein